MSKDVWNEMGKIVDPELLPSRQEINESSDIDLVFASVSYEQHDEMGHVTDEREKLSGNDVISDGLFLHITQSIYPTKRKCFAMHALGLEESEYDQIITEKKGAWSKNYQVVFLKSFQSQSI